MKRNSQCFKKFIKLSVLSLAGIFLLIILFSTISNLFLPKTPDDPEELSEQTTLHASEAINLLTQLGGKVWPEFGADLPIILWNDQTAFLVNNSKTLGDWETIEGVVINGNPVLRQPNTKPYQAFAETLSTSQPAGSMATKNQMNREIVQLFKQNLPPVFKQVFPYQLVLQSTDLYITTLVHETFHAFQKEQYPQRFEDAEKAYPKRNAYEGIFEEMSESWLEEIECLQSAVQEEDKNIQKAITRQCLDLREDRRQSAGLTPNLELYEKRFEWLEGSAKYVELKIWELAAVGPYQPVKGLVGEKEFHAYQKYDARWKTELKNMERAAENGGDTLFYYTGMLQERLLDDLMPDWKSRMGESEIWLEDLLHEAVS